MIKKSHTNDRDALMLRNRRMIPLSSTRVLRARLDNVGSLLKTTLLGFLLTLVAIAAAIQSTAGPYRIELRTDPSIIVVGRSRVTLNIADSAGKPATGLTVKTLVQMPGMAMGEREETAVPGPEPGTYTSPAVFAMDGRYEATIKIAGPQGNGNALIPLQTGQNTVETGGGGLQLGTISIWAIVLIGVLLVLWQVRRTGQRIAWRSFANRNVVLSLLVLAAAMAVVVWAVNNLRRPGAMTPIEGQVMDMSSPAPDGVLPVRLSRVERKPFASTVTYSGQAVGFTEQDIVPRVTGAIVSIPVYVGDHVTKGQVLVRLDTSQIDPMVNEKAAGVTTAQQGVGVAAMEYEQALNGVTQARAEVSMAAGEQAEANAMLDAARQGRGSAESAVTSAQAEVEAMKAELTAMQAERTYQEQDLERSRTLYAQGAISKDEWQRAQAEAGKADAQVGRARENVNRAQAGVNSARAELRRTDAEIAAARRKVQQAQAQVRAKQAAVKTAESAASAAKHRIGQSQAGVAEAAAGLRGATTQRGYSELRSDIDGVVTQRLISPGTVVAPGQAVLRVAQIRPIRLQANVAESDLSKIPVGASVKVTRRGVTETATIARVTSVAPSVDTASRTGVVEALFANVDQRFLPGQFVTMEITIAADKDAVVVPSAALQTEGDRTYVWVAESPVNGEYTAARREVIVMGRAGESAAVSGLNPGQTVILAPPPGLVAGTQVSASNETPALASATQTVEITAAGYNPPFINVPAGKPFRITFIRRTDESCGTEVIFPGLGIKKALPLNQPVTIEIPPQPAGKALNFTCGMNMLKGKAVAQ